ncbi:WG repeat-containing protein [uncultured Muribaculum sp.]|uniref:WG repeat-containing protein n=1 Tax=uncultured Muribaculum sp. TaxID=1918613 RepID=UPI00272F7986|nr:WG repeat-containing protein [uncultured Muribaculum sp.]
MIKRLLLFTILITAAVSVSAETAVWSVLPEYNGITRLSDDLFIVEKGARSAIIDASGKEVIPMTLDSITPMVDGKSLLLTRDGNDFRLRSIIFENQRIVNVDGEYFVGDYPFFSEGMLPVYNKKGYYGYIDDEGRLAIEFKYRNIHPFSEGLASVSKVSTGMLGSVKNKVSDLANNITKRKTRVYFIDMHGKELKLQKDIGNITMGSTFLNGESVVEDTKGNFFVINTQGRMIKRLGNEDLTFDDRYSVVSDDDVAQPVKASGPQPFFDNRKYGYRSTKGSVVVVPQFNYAYPFENGHAIVKSGAFWGILASSDGKFDVTKRIVVKRRKNVDEVVEYNVTVPAGYADTPLSMVIDADGQKTEETSESGATRQFKIKTPESDYKLYLMSANLILWSANEDVQTRMETADMMRISVSKSSKADKNDRAPITVRISNPTDDEVTIEVKVTGENLTPVTKTLTIPEKSSRSISTAFNNVTVASSKTVAVSIEGKTSYFKVNPVTPFFVDF